MLPPASTPLTAGRTPGGRATSPSSTRWSSMSFLIVAAGVQLVLFVSFIGFFFTQEQHRQGELSDMQGELHRLRSENAR